MADERYIQGVIKTESGETYETLIDEAEIGSSPSIVYTGITLEMGDWSLVSGLYEIDYDNVDILSTSIVDVIPSNSTIEVVKIAEICPYVLVSSGSIKMYSKHAPTGDIDINIVIGV